MKHCLLDDREGIGLLRWEVDVTLSGPCPVLENGIESPSSATRELITKR
jgi:hypothetical protein